MSRNRSTIAMLLAFSMQRSPCRAQRRGCGSRTTRAYGFLRIGFPFYQKNRNYDLAHKLREPHFGWTFLFSLQEMIPSIVLEVSFINMELLVVRKCTGAGEMLSTAVKSTRCSHRGPEFSF